MVSTAFLVWPVATARIATRLLQIRLRRRCLGADSLRDVRITARLRRATRRHHLSQDQATSASAIGPESPLAPAMVRRPFRTAVGFNTHTAVGLILVFGIVRMALVMQANVTGSYQVVSTVFVAMAVLPWVLLTGSGRRAM